jgi:FMN phosphatase YigB (HAD superfamily)
MTIRAVIFDLGGVLIEIDWDTYRRDQHSYVQEKIGYPYDYERLNIQLAQFVAALRPWYKTAIICNQGSREAANRKFKLRELVDLMVFDGEEGVSKPDVRIYQRALARLEVKAEEAVFVDDKIKNVEAARHIGMIGILFEDTVQAIEDVKILLAR